MSEDRISWDMPEHDGKNAIDVLIESVGMKNFDKSGKQIPYSEFSKLYLDMDYRTIGKTTIPGESVHDGGGPVEVSTMWVRNMGYDETPIIFETMFFGGNHDAELFDRYATEDAAKAGHEAAVKWIREGGER